MTTVTTISILFTDIVGSTRLLEQHPEAMPAALTRYDQLLRQAVAASRGEVFTFTGDSHGAAFALASDALDAALAAQRAVNAEAWDEVEALQVRMAMHTGAAVQRDGNFFGAALNAAARLVRATHGNQILISDAVAALVRDHLPEQVELRDLGEHRLKDLARPMRVFQVLAPDLSAEFPALSTLDVLQTTRRLRGISLEMLSLLDRDAILSQLTSELPAVFPTKSAALFLLDPADGVFRRAGGGHGGRARGPAPTTLLPRESLLLHHLKEAGRPVGTAGSAIEAGDLSLSASDWAAARRLGASLWVPLRPWGRLVGVLALGGKASGEPYSEEERDALCLIANEAAVALENAAYSEEREKQARLQQELAIARSMQMSLLPPSRLRLTGYELLSRSEPSAEVGGDFYNYYPVGEQTPARPTGEPSIAVPPPADTPWAAGVSRLGILLGDVAGKGIPAALFMAVTTTLVQGQARLLLSPAATLAAANAELYLKMRAPGAGRPLFATAVYAVLNVADGTVSLANAGQTPPIYWPIGGMPRYLRLRGVPLGALAASTYEESALRLKPGDRLLFCTDGFIEEAGEDGRPVGYEGLLRRLSALNQQDAPDLIESLFAQRREPVAGPIERDDRTLVLITALAE